MVQLVTVFHCAMTDKYTMNKCCHLVVTIFQISSYNNTEFNGNT